MSQNREIAQGFVKDKKEDVTAFWKKLFEELNSVGPPVKNITKWKKVEYLRMDSSSAASEPLFDTPIVRKPSTSFIMIGVCNRNSIGRMHPGPTLFSVNGSDLNAGTSLSDDSGLTLTTNSSISSGDSIQLDMCKYEVDIIGSDEDASFQSFDHCSVGGMSTENFNTLKRGPFTPIDPPLEFQDSPKSTIIRSAENNASKTMNRWPLSTAYFEDPEEISDKLISKHKLIYDSKHIKGSYSINKHLHSSDSFLNAHTDNIYDEPNNIISTSLENCIDVCESKSSSTFTALVPNIGSHSICSLDNEKNKCQQGFLSSQEHISNNLQILNCNETLSKHKYDFNGETKNKKTLQHRYSPKNRIFKNQPYNSYQYNALHYASDDIEQIDSNDNTRSKIEDVFIGTKANLRSLLNSAKESSTLSSTINPNLTHDSSHAYSNRLPKLKLLNFDGTYSEYKRFIECFKNLVDNDANIPQIEKFNYLLNCLSGPALIVVESIEVTADNYKLALKRLQDRFDNPVLIFLDYISSLFNLQIMRKSDAVSLRKIIDTTAALRSSLLSLGNAINVMDAVVIHLVRTKLDDDSKNHYDEKQDFANLPSWNQCYTILDRRCLYLETQSKTTDFGQREQRNKPGSCSCGNRAHSRNSLNSRLSSSHNSLCIHTTNKADDSIFITQAMSHDALLSREISDFYNVPIDSDIYAFPIDMVTSRNECLHDDNGVLSSAKKINIFVQSNDTLVHRLMKYNEKDTVCKSYRVKDGKQVHDGIHKNNVKSKKVKYQSQIKHKSTKQSNENIEQHSHEPLQTTLEEVKQFYQTLYSDTSGKTKHLRYVKNGAAISPKEHRSNVNNTKLHSATDETTTNNLSSYKKADEETTIIYNNDVAISGHNNVQYQVPNIKNSVNTSKGIQSQQISQGKSQNQIHTTITKQTLQADKKSQFNLNLKQKLCSIFRFRKSGSRCVNSSASDEYISNSDHTSLQIHAEDKKNKFQSRALPPLPKLEPRRMLSCGYIEQRPELQTYHFTSSIEKVKDYGWYWGPLSSEAAENILSNEPDGSFIVRDSSDDHYIFSLSFKLNSCVRHVRIEQDQGTFSFGSYAKFKSQTITEFIEKAVDHSRSGRYLFFLHRRPEHGPMRVQLTNPVSRFKHVQSLQHICRFVILKAVIRKDLIQTLPLPRRLLDYVNYKHCYSEQVESDCSHSQITGDSSNNNT